MAELARITRLSAWLFRAATGLAWALPLVVIGVLLRGWFAPATLRAQYPMLPADAVITPVQVALVAGIALVALLPMVAALRAMARLFNRYRRGEILSDGCADDILRIGRAMIFVAAATVLVPTLNLLVLTWNATPRTLQIGVEGGTLGFLLSAGLLTAIGWVMREAARLKAENEAFI